MHSVFLLEVGWELPIPQTIKNVLVAGTIAVGVGIIKSKRDEWFDELQRIGINVPWTQKIPDKYLTDEWYKGMG